jgi:hypothetical protein
MGVPLIIGCSFSRQAIKRHLPHCRAGGWVESAIVVLLFTWWTLIV